MITASSNTEFDKALQRLLDEHGCLLVSSRHLANEARTVYEDCLVFDMETGAARRESFFTYIVDNGTAIFLFDGDPFLVYAFSCNPHELITHVESEFATDDVGSCKEYVATLLGKRADIAVKPSIAYEWMGVK